MLLNMDFGREHHRGHERTAQYRQWEETASAAMGHVWFTDCDFSQHQTVDHKRPAIVLSALEQLIWDNRDDCDEEVGWIESRLSSLDRHFFYGFLST